MADPVSIFAWASVVIELGYMGAQLLALGRQMQSGQAVTDEQLAAAKAADHAALAALEAAGQFDRPG